MTRCILGTLFGVTGLIGPSLAAPRAPQAAPSARVQTSLQQDARLGKKVSLRLRKSPLSTVVAELGRQTGVMLTAAPDVADEPAILFVTDQPAREVMHHLATLFNFRWTRKGEPDQPGYELYQDLKSRQEEEALRQREMRQALDGLQRAIRARVDLARRSPEALGREAEALAAEEAAIDAALSAGATGSPRLVTYASPEAARRRSLALNAAGVRVKAMADPLQRALLRIAASLTPAQWASLGEGQPLLFSTRGEDGALRLPAALAQELRGARLKWGEPHIQYRHDSPEDEARFRQMEAEFQQGWDRAEAIRVSIWLEVKPRAFSSLDHAVRPGEAPSRQAVLQVTPMVQPAADFRSMFMTVPTGLKVANQEVPETLDGKPEERQAAGTPGSTPADDPILGIKRRFPLKLKFADPDYGAPRFQFLNEVLPRIAERYGINLVADAYRQRFPMWPPEASEQELTLREVLDRYVLPRARWSREGVFVHVRRWTWYDDRLAEIPKRVVRQWSDRLRPLPRLSLEDAAALALALRDEQLETFEAVMRDQGLTFGGVTIGPAFRVFENEVLPKKEILRVYASLSSTQQQSLLAGRPLPWTAMPAEARRWLRTALWQQLRVPADPFDNRRHMGGTPVLAGASPHALRLTPVTITDDQAPGGTYVRHDFDAQFPEDTNPADFFLFSPRIELKKPPASEVILTDREPKL